MTELRLTFGAKNQGKILKPTEVKEMSDCQKQIEGEALSRESVGLEGDRQNVALLVFLYLVQGIPLGITNAIPILLQSRGASYAEQAVFTIAFIPFSIKILWAPFVDSVYVKSLGRRKSWLIPAQFLIGLLMICFAGSVNKWLGNGINERPQMVLLTTFFFIIWVLTATQDISLDGWALTMLKRRNVGYVSTCNAVGQTSGELIGYVLLLLLESKDFADRFIFENSDGQSLVTLEGFLRFWGVFFLLATTFVALFKHEANESDTEMQNHPSYGIRKAYPMLWQIIKLKPVLQFALVLVTFKASFAACDEVTTLKLIEYGIPKEKVALLSIPLMPAKILLPFLITKFTHSAYPMTYFMKNFPFRLFMTIVIALFLYCTPWMNDASSSEGVSVYYYIAFIVIYLIYIYPFRAMFVAELAFIAKVADPLVGGTYMTLLTSISNFGGRFMKTFFLSLVDVITWKSCAYDHLPKNSTITLPENDCKSLKSQDECDEYGGKCQVVVDGYYIEILLCVAYGLVWYRWGSKALENLQKLPRKDWLVFSNQRRIDETTPLIRALPA